MATTPSFSGNEKAIFDNVGHFGPWQRNVFIVLFLTRFVGVFHSTGMTFLAPNMEYKCVEAELITINATSSARHQTSDWLVSAFQNSTNQCEVKLSNVTEYEEEDTFVRCTRWEYDTSVYSQTLVSEWDLVCDRDWLISFAKSVYMMGFLATMVITSHLSDIVGRRPVLIACFIITALAAVIINFSNSYTMFLIMRFFLAFGRHGVSNIGQVLLMEIIGPEYRTKINIANMYSWPLSLMFLPAITWFVRHWFWQQLAITMPVIPLACMFWIFPESPRWLMTQNRNEEFLKVCKQGAKKNGKYFNEELLSPSLLLNVSSNTTNTKKNILDVLKSTQMRKRILSMSFIWGAVTFQYYSVTYNTNELGGNPYLALFLVGSAALLGQICLFYASWKWGQRKRLLILITIVTGAAFAAGTAVPHSVSWGKITLAAITEFACAFSLTLLWVYTSECFPTVVRTSAVGSNVVSGRIGAILAPFTRDLDKAAQFSVSGGICAGLSILSTLIALLLPETQNLKFPDTLEEGEHLGVQLKDLDIEEDPSLRNGEMKL